MHCHETTEEDDEEEDDYSMIISIINTKQKKKPNNMMSINSNHQNNIEYIVYQVTSHEKIRIALICQTLILYQKIMKTT